MSILQDDPETSEPKLILKRAVKEGPDVTKVSVAEAVLKVVAVLTVLSLQ